nr:MAG TPA: hypothetical protein [Caudoviricetes sp.]
MLMCVLLLQLFHSIINFRFYKYSCDRQIKKLSIDFVERFFGQSGLNCGMMS